MSNGADGGTYCNAGAAEPLVSVIVPVYNVARTLDRCVNSILHQTYQHLEIILIDDGSTDGSSRLCDALDARDSRIKVIHQRNQGLSAARNVGVDHAHGVFVCFVDSDDWLMPEYVGSMVDAAVRYQADMVICGYSNVSMSGNTSQSLPYGGVCNGREYLNHADIINSVYTVAWNRLYRIDLCRTVRFPDNLLYEDRYTFFRFFHEANIVVGLGKSLYCYDNNPDGITHAINDVRKLDLAQVYLTEIRFYLDHGYDSILRGYANTLTELFLKLIGTVYRQRKEESREAYPQRVNWLLAELDDLLPRIRPYISSCIAAYCALLCRHVKVYMAFAGLRYRWRGHMDPLFRLLHRAKAWVAKHIVRPLRNMSH
ncbi:glycosyltransferase family 2 protein [Bifidobacterium felsineum]|uniref:glycosyltransferase family 2 protein n=1 Tax=Bifidobacterium felsineum TaxID=2045440 RepID=UPI001BDC8627|nr:glycosyltransferase family 2 protein [Bifidobacterium felsineum]MBT1164794.1 glycosyltransferase family 2 protein [Bifidobacterium felsineum]